MANLKCYVGSSVDVKKRIAQHKSSLKRQEHQNGHLQNAWNKYGENSFMFEWVEITDDLENREQFWMDDMRVFELGYNLAPIAYSNRGVKHTEETKRKFSLAKIGKSPANKGKPMPEEQKIKCAPTMFKKGSVPHNKGVPLSDETREKVSKAVRESHQRPEVREKVSRTWFQPGRKQSPELIEKRRIGRLNYFATRTPEEKEKHRIARLNYYASLTPEERKAKYGRSQKNKNPG